MDFTELNRVLTSMAHPSPAPRDAHADPKQLILRALEPTPERPTDAPDE